MNEFEMVMAQLEIQEEAVDELMKAVTSVRETYDSMQEQLKAAMAKKLELQQKALELHKKMQ